MPISLSIKLNIISSFKYIKIKERITLINKIKSREIKMPSYNRYDKRGLECLVLGDFARYSECVRSSQKCDVLGPSSKD